MDEMYVAAKVYGEDVSGREVFWDLSFMYG